MAYREIAMWEILEVLRRVHRGEGQRAVQRVTGHSRSTLRRWVACATELGWAASVQEPDEALARRVAERMQPVAVRRGPGESEAQLAAHRDQIRAWLAPDASGRGLRLSKVHRLLARRGVAVPYSSLHRFAVAHCGFRDERRVTVRVAEAAPGELAEVDFGRLGFVHDPETGKRRTLHALIVTLVHSRHQYVHVCPTQTLADLLEGLEDAWAFFGGVPARVVLDNLKAAVTKADRYDPVFARTFAEYAAWRGFVIDAAVPRHPRGKPHVERGVQYLRESFFRGETWIDRDHVQREGIRWCLEVAGQRIHGTTRKRPMQVFHAVEKAKLAPLARPRFDPPVWRACKVHPDHHIQFQKALYSVPTRYVGQRVWVRGDSKLVRVYVGGELVKTHERMEVGKRSTDYRDYPPERAPYAMRDPDAIVEEAKRRGAGIGRFAATLLAGPFPWAKLRQAQKLLRLGQRYGFERLDAACRRALAFELLNVKRVEQIVLAGLDRAGGGPEPSPGELIPLPARFLRPTDHFTHEGKEPHGDQPIAQDPSQTPEALGPARDAARPRGLCPEDEAS
jgi:Mu transposase, C-terminal domain